MDNQLRQSIDRVTEARSATEAASRILSVCDAINADSDGPKIATPLILDKLRYSDNDGQFNTLQLLEGCVVHCGKSFHGIVGKYKVLNELIRLLSRKHYPDADERTRKTVLMLIQKWNRDLDQPKIKEAYEKLKMEGHRFPETEPSDYLPGGMDSFLKKKVLSLRKSSLDNADKEIALKYLLHSNDVSDLQAANKLIKSMIQAEELLQDEKYRLHKDLETTRVKITQFQDMLDSQGPCVSTCLKDLHKTMVVIKPRLIRLCAEFDDDEDVGEVLDLTDDLQQCLDRYSRLASQPLNSEIDGPGHEEDSSEVFTDDLLGLGESCWLKQHSQANMGIGGAELDPLDQGLDDLSALASLTLGTGQETPVPSASEATMDDLLAPLFLAPNELVLSTHSPLAVHEGHGVQVVLQALHVALPARVLGCCLCFLNHNPFPCTALHFQAAVPKAMRVKLQLASSTTLPAFNVVTGATPVTQVCFIANPSKACMKMKFILSYTAQDQHHTVEGAINDIPFNVSVVGG